MIRGVRSSRLGFTIIESVVVLLVIILLASIVIPGLLGRTGEEPQLPRPGARAGEAKATQHAAAREVVEPAAGGAGSAESQGGPGER